MNRIFRINPAALRFQLSAFDFCLDSVWLSRLRFFTAATPVGSVAKPKLDADNFQARRKFNGNRFDELFPIKPPPAAVNKL
jgi:hypothetical protein